MKALAHVLILMSLVCTFAMVMTYDSQAQKVDESLVLYLPFDEEEGNETADLSTYDHIVNSAGKLEWTDGKVGSALEFEKTNFIEVPIGKDLQLRENFTVEFWVKMDADEGGGMIAAGGAKWQVNAELGGRHRVYVNTNEPPGGFGPRVYSVIRMPDEWTHIAFVHDLAAASILYINGVENNRSKAEIGVVDVIDTSIRIGSINGVMDEVAFYNRVLSPEEIRRDMAKVGGAAVSPQGKLPSAWGSIKTSY